MEQQDLVRILDFVLLKKKKSKRTWHLVDFADFQANHRVSIKENEKADE